MQCSSDFISVELRHHLDRGIELHRNEFRYGSTSWAELIREARELYHAGHLNDLVEEDYVLLESDAGELAEFQGRSVLLDTPEIDHDSPEYLIVHVREDGVVKRVRLNTVTSSTIVTI